MRKNLIASRALCVGALSCWKIKNSLEILCMVDRNCCNSITLRVILHNDFDSVIEKYQTGVASTTCHSLTVAVSDWTHCVQAFCHDVFLGWWMCVQSVILWVFGVVAVNIFSPVNKNVANIIMVALCNRADHYIFALLFLSSIFFFPLLISAAAGWMSAILWHMVWP